MRPRGEIRQALGSAAQALAAEAGGGTWRDLGRAACVGWTAARETVKNMASAGELVPVGTVRVKGARRPMVRYAPAGAQAGSWVSPDAAGALDAALRGWHS